MEAVQKQSKHHHIVSPTQLYIVRNMLHVSDYIIHLQAKYLNFR